MFLLSVVSSLMGHLDDPPVLYPLCIGAISVEMKRRTRRGRAEKNENLTEALNSTKRKKKISLIMNMEISFK